MTLKRSITTILALTILTTTNAQQPDFSSLKQQITESKNDTVKLTLLTSITEAYNEIRPDSSYFFAEELLTISQKLNLKLNEAFALDQMAYALLNMGNYPKSLQTFLSGLVIAEDPKSEKNVLPEKYLELNKFFKRPITAHNLRLDVLARINHYIGILYGTTNNYNKELIYYLKAKQITGEVNNKAELCTIYSNMGRVYISLNNLDSALICEQKAYDLAMESGNKKYLGSILLNFGRIQSALGNKKLAISYFKKAIDSSFEQNYLRGAVASNLYLSDIYKQSGNKDSALHCAREGLKVARYQNTPSLLLRSYTTLATLYKAANNNDSVVKYQGMIIKMNDSIFNSKQAQLFQNIDFDEQKRQKEITGKEQQFINNVKTYSLIAALAIFLLIAFILFRNNRYKQKANALLTKEKEKVEQTLGELKTTQARLIHSEKMASLGALTAGIAGHNEQTDINALADECLKLAYAGIKGKDKGFPAEIKTDFDGNIGTINIIPQDISRVFMNLFNNAFYAVNEKKKIIPKNYKPFVAVSTKKIIGKSDNGRIEIRITDNGIGIPPNIIDKIFQPFFTTKPMGQGTGMGLSLSYDIIKSHNGEIRVVSEANTYTVFTVVLPC